MKTARTTFLAAALGAVLLTACALVPLEASASDVAATDSYAAAGTGAMGTGTTQRGYNPNIFAFYWSTATTTSTSRDYISDFSLRGFIFEYKYRFHKNWSFGGLISWNVFDEKQTGTQTLNNLTYTGTQLRYMDATYLALSAHYYIITGTPRVLPFVGLDLGSTYTSRTTDLAWWSLSEDGWHFALAPELGVAVDIVPEFSFLVSAKFNWSMETDNAPEELFFTFNFGFGFNV